MSDYNRRPTRRHDAPAPNGRRGHQSHPSQGAPRNHAAPQGYSAHQSRPSTHQSRPNANQRPASPQQRYAAADARREATPHRTRHAQVGYVEHPRENPYAKADVGRVDMGYLNVQGHAAHGRPRPRRNPTRAFLAVVGIAVVAALIAVFAFTHRPVQVEINGTRRSFTIDTPIQDIIKAQGLTPKTGNLTSVSGNVLEQGGGTPYTLKVNGQELDRDAASKFRIAGDEYLEVSDGKDVREDADVTYEETAPKLEMKGSYGAIGYISQWPQTGKVEQLKGKISGESATGDTVQEVKNCVVTLHNVEPSGNNKVVALTFDDGPGQDTQQFLDVLARYNVKATFFNTGDNEQRYPDLARACVEAGHAVMSHSYDHPDLAAATEKDVYDELHSTFEIIKNTTGQATTSIRPPYGSFKQMQWLYTKGEMSCSVLWNMDSLDWKLPGVDAIVNNSCNGITNGAIILMHDGGGDRSQGVEAVPKIIERLQGEGYRFVTIPELMATDPSIPSDIATGAATMPEGCTWPTEIATD